MNKLRKIKNLYLAGLILYLLSNKSYKLIKGNIKANHILLNHHDNHVENVVAHRGFSGLYQENSIDSVREALNLDCVDMIEIDIRYTKNKQFVLCHDSFVSIEDILIQIEDLSLDDDLEELIIDNYKSYNLDNLLYDDTLFLQKRFLNQTYYENKIVRLSTILNMFKFTKPLILDVKTDLVNIEMINDLSKLIEPISNNIFIQSNYYPFLVKMMEIYPNYQYLYIINNKSSIIYNDKLSGYTVKYSILDKIKINKDKMYLIWTINSNQKYLNLLNNRNYNNNMYIITDNPDYICSLGEDKKLRK